VDRPPAGRPRPFAWPTRPSVTRFSPGAASRAVSCCCATSGPWRASWRVLSRSPRGWTPRGGAPRRRPPRGRGRGARRSRGRTARIGPRRRDDAAPGPAGAAAARPAPPAGSRGAAARRGRRRRRERALGSRAALRTALGPALEAAERYTSREEIATWRRWIEETRAWSRKTGQIAILVLKEKNASSSCRRVPRSGPTTPRSARTRSG